MAPSRAVRRARSSGVRRVATALVGGHRAWRRQSPASLRRIVADYEVASLLLDNGQVPVRWWVHADNFGDQLSPWLISRMTGREVALAPASRPHYLGIGSILKQASANSLVWGSGSFGTEAGSHFATKATYTAVRGPLSRARLAAVGISCPEVYGDPALLAPAYFSPKVEKTHEYGIVTRWSERRWHQAEVHPDVRLIDLGTTDVEGVIEAMLSCRRIVTGSLHGLVVADAYRIPSAWVMSLSASGGMYKFFDYFATVNKFRTAQRFERSRAVTPDSLRDALVFDNRTIEFDYRALLDACPFLQPRSNAVEQILQQDEDLPEPDRRVHT